VKPGSWPLWVELSLTVLLALVVIGMGASVNAITRTDTDELYSEAIYMHRDHEEVPGALESSARLAAEDEGLEYLSTASDLEGVNPSEITAPVNVKKLSQRRGSKKSSKN
jgi:hypothetical protein